MKQSTAFSSFFYGGRVNRRNQTMEAIMVTFTPPANVLPLRPPMDAMREVRVEGLETLDYLDNLQNKKHFTEQGDAITFESEVDRIYLSTPTKIAIIDHEKKRTFVLKKDGLADAVVWNPWEKKAKSMADFGDDEYKHMLFIEAATLEKPFTLKLGEEWKGRQELSAM